ncbi:uncharacterized protein LOC124467780 [Hypomesus transpacificus]|uniref:uncharacterized protein LOC124467780 n=1 Tax=Hypomesus transpacificus TaxID=137520 RepID=UPI001F07EDFC|nr:uncharacterized protein LOC124467780 [Hypomesus transpacificus]
MRFSHFTLTRQLQAGWCQGPGGDAHGTLRRFLLMKVVIVLLFPSGAVLPLLVGCVFSLQALLLLRSPHTSTKPSTVLLRQLALTDALVLLCWGLGLGMQVGLWMELGLGTEVGLGTQVGLVAEGDQAKEVGLEVEVGLGTQVGFVVQLEMLCQGFLDAHHLASLLLLGMLGLEASLVSHWPLQTRWVRTSYFARLACTFIWVFALLEPLALQACWLYQALGSHAGLQSLPDSDTGSLGTAAGLQACTVLVLPFHTALTCLRVVLWLANARLHYDVLYNKPQRRKSFFH